MDRADTRSRPGSRAFTLVEVMVAMVVGSIVLLAVISAFLYLGKSATNLAQYTDMESQVHRALLQAGSDIRQASDANWTDANTLVVTVNGSTVTYAYNATAKTFTRTPAGGTTSTLVSGISTFQFQAFDINGNLIDLTSNLATASSLTKLVQLQFVLVRSALTASVVTDSPVSARFLMRNKKVG